MTLPALTKSSKKQLKKGFIKITDHLPTDPPTTYPPTYRSPSSTYVKTED